MTSSIDIFPWNQNFNTGIPVVDEQHEMLVQLLNELASHVAYHSDLPALDNIFNRLADYATFHFQTEEDIWHEYLAGDALESGHKAVHNDFVATVLKTKEKIDSAGQDAIIEELLAFLTRWLTSHILENDRYMAAVVLNIQSGTEIDQAKRLAKEQMGGSTKVLIDIILYIYERLSVNTLGLMRELKYRKEQEEKIKQYAAQLEDSFMRAVGLATTMSEMRDPYTVGHERRVAEIAVAIGKEMGLDALRIEGLNVGGHVHDLGKISIPAEILGKPGRLSAIELELIKSHAKAGFEILKNVGFPWPVDQIALRHHERFDGSGYPDGLKGDAILLEARIMAVADVVEAMSSHRPYRPGLGIEKALAEIERGRGTAYDPVVADSCLKLFRENGFKLPSGSHDQTS
jgi:hemerythrin-like metal-binding protein